MSLSASWTCASMEAMSWEMESALPGRPGVAARILARCSASSSLGPAVVFAAEPWALSSLLRRSSLSRTALALLSKVHAARGSEASLGFGVGAFPFSAAGLVGAAAVVLGSSGLGAGVLVV